MRLRALHDTGVHFMFVRKERAPLNCLIAYPPAIKLRKIPKGKPMKKKTISAAVAVLAIGATMAFATMHDGKEGKGGWDGHRGGFSEMYAQKLNLTDAQKTQIADLDKNFRETNKALFEASHQTREQFKAAKDANDTAKLDALRPTMDSQHAQMKQLRDAQDARIKTILTPEQRAQFDTLKAEREARHGEHKEQH
jgi:Spy/CpxP family protein refolding chaperone